MANQKITALTALTGANVSTSTDVLPIVQTSTTTTKKILVSELAIAMGPAMVSTVAATKAQQQTGSVSSVIVTPSVQQYHDSAAKAYGVWTSSGVISFSYNISSVTVNGVGDNTAFFTTPFADSNYTTLVTSTDSGNIAWAGIFGKTASSVRITIRNAAGNLTDLHPVNVLCFGRQ